MKNKIVTINSRKIDGKIHRSWEAELVFEKDSLLIFKGIFADEVIHQDLGVIRRGTVSYEYYWTDRWYNVFRFHEPDGEFRNFYCNVNQPPILKNSVLDYIDLDIDILVDRDFNFRVLDVAEFEEHIIKYNYDEKLISKAKEQTEELKHLIVNRSFPFSETDTNY